MRVLSIGECMVELSPTGAAGTYRQAFAGDTFNTAWYLRRLLPPDAAVDYLTAVGTDALSDRMVDFMAMAGIGTAHVQRRADRTVGLYMIELTAGERSFAYWRGESAARTLADDEGVLDRALAGATLAYVSGITLAILPPDGRRWLMAALSAFRATGGTVAFDPNLRPRLWPGADAMRAGIMAAAAVADIALPSHEDEAAWFGDPDPAATARRYGGAGAGTVVVKNGAGPITLMDGGRLSDLAPVQAASVVDTTAAGDSFNAGFLAAWLAGAVATKAVATGARVAAQVIAARGALVPVTV